MNINTMLIVPKRGQYQYKSLQQRVQGHELEGAHNRAPFFDTRRVVPYARRQRMHTAWTNDLPGHKGDAGDAYRHRAAQ